MVIHRPWGPRFRIISGLAALTLFAACSQAVSSWYAETIIPEKWLKEPTLQGLQAAAGEVMQDSFYHLMAYRFPDVSAEELRTLSIEGYQETTDPLGSEGKTTLLILKVDAANHGDLERAKSLVSHGQALLINGMIARLDPQPGDVEQQGGLIAKKPGASNHFLRARALAKAGDLGKALWDLDVAIGLDSTQAVFYEARARIRVSQGDSVHARDDFARASRMKEFPTPAFPGP